MLVVGVHLLLKSVVLNPLERAVSLLDQEAHGDLTARIDEPGKNEIKRLLQAIARMQQDLLSTVSRRARRRCRPSCSSFCRRATRPLSLLPAPATNMRRGISPLH